MLRNFEGFITTYQEPLDYDPHAIKHQESLIEHRPEPGQDGILSLLEEKQMYIAPEGFEDTRARGGVEHRLRSGDLEQKWNPLGVGAIEPAKIALADGSAANKADDSAETG